MYISTDHTYSFPEILPVRADVDKVCFDETFYGVIKRKQNKRSLIIFDTWLIAKLNHW